MDKILQPYFDYYVKYYEPKKWKWYSDLSKYIRIMNDTICEMKSVEVEGRDEPELTEKLNTILSKSSDKEIVNIYNFLDRYLFLKENGLGDIGQGMIWDSVDNPHKTEILKRFNSKKLINLLKQTEVEKTKSELDLLLGGLSRNYPGVIIRFLRAMYPDLIVSPDAPNKLSRLTNSISSKLGLSIEGSDISKHQQLSKLIETDDNALRQMFMWELYDMFNSDIDLKKALVFYGAPGTGKTFKAKKLAKEKIDSFRLKNQIDKKENYVIQTIQFHPSYSYEDFVEGIRPSKDRELKLFNGSFKKFCKEAGAAEIRLYMETDFLEKFKKEQHDFSRIKVSELHPEHRSILNIKDVKELDDLNVSEVIEPAFFIIDEINRADLSRVFGELMYCLEYRGYNGKIKTQYSYLINSKDDESTFYWDGNSNWFFIPQNIYLIGTMNNIDRSVDSFDFALRRRFKWEEIEPNEDLINDILKTPWSEDLSNSLKRLNKLISSDDVLGKDYRIGHAYALSIEPIKAEFDNGNEVKQFLWDDFLKSLFEEYLRGLGDDKLSREKIERFKSEFGI